MLGPAVLLAPSRTTAHAGQGPPARGPGDLLRPPLWIDADDRDIPEPAARDISEIYDILYNSWLRHFDPGSWGRRSRHPALNVNAWDEVPDSSWFTNRIGLHAFGPQQLVAGPPGDDPEPGTWHVTSLKTEGYTPGLQIRDSTESRFFLKFDLPEAPERNSAAERIGSLIMWAAGYNVPPYAIVRFRAEDLVVGDDAVFEDAVGRQRPMTDDDVTEALSLLAPRPDGTYRGITSLFLSGAIKGPFSYSGRRRDDPNDIIPHQLRREIRGLRVIASWFNHVDVKEANTLDTFVEEDGRRFLRHYLIDFGSSMGSGDFVNGPCRVGFEHIFDGRATGLALLTFGAWERPWEASCDIPYAEVGRFEAELFDAAGWRPNYPNLAFDAMDDADGYWAAKIVTAFTDDHVRGLAEAGRYTRPEVTDFVEETFRRRRDKIGGYWLDRVTPLEAFELQVGPDTWTLRFRDLGLERGYAAGNRAYLFEVRSALGADLLDEGRSDEATRIRFAPVDDIPTARPDRWGRIPLALVDLRVPRRDGEPALPVRVILGYQQPDRAPRVLGWSHAPR